jgi:hypothetical protein
MAQGEPTAPDEGTPADAPVKDRAKDEAKDEEAAADDLQKTLHEGEVGPVSRVMGTRIVSAGVKPYIHGTIVVEWDWEDGPDAEPNSLELRESHLYLGAHILDFAQPEVFFQFYQPDQGSLPLTVLYSQVDLQLYRELAVVRLGLFLIPFGVYNTDLFLRYLAKLPDPPQFHRDLVPQDWAEIGAQLRGRWEWSPGRSLTYQAYVTNGQVSVLDGTHLTYDEAVDSLGSSKSFGARVAVQPLDGLEIGLSGYHGTVDGQAGGLLLAGLDFTLRQGAFSADGEWVLGQRRHPQSHAMVPGSGAFVAAGYKVTDALEPVLSAGWVSTSPGSDDNEVDLSAGLNFYPFADRFTSAVLKAAYTRRLIQGGQDGNVVQVLVAIGY